MNNIKCQKCDNPLPEITGMRITRDDKGTAKIAGIDCPSCSDNGNYTVTIANDDMSRAFYQFNIKTDIHEHISVIGEGNE